MRIIEPRDFKKLVKKRRSLSRRALAIVLFLLAGLSVYVYSAGRGSSSSPPPEQAVAGVRVLRDFTRDELVELYPKIQQSNLESITQPPHITGNQAADERIQRLAQDFGYRLERLPESSLKGLAEPDIYLQAGALQAWGEMKNAARLADLSLRMSSGYMSVDQQRAEFLRQLRDSGVFTESVALGYVDDRVQRVLKILPPPGYSRHHTGYVIKINCKDACLEWLAADNYRNAKTFGWIPSYSPNAAGTEFVWVGKNTTYR